MANKYINRRQFLKTTTTLGVSLAMLKMAVPFVDANEPSIAGGITAPITQNETLPSESTPSIGRVKFSVFADLHHYPGVFMSQTPEHLVQIQTRAKQEHCDFIIHCGDFTHHPPKCLDFIERYNNFELPSYHVLGNHDHDGCSWEETLASYKMSTGHYYFDCHGFRFVILDPNYIFKEGVYLHYTKGNYSKCEGHEHPFLPPDQLVWLQETLRQSPGPCVLFSHQSFEREKGGILNWAAIRKIITDTNRQFPGRVRLCINGHHHRDFLRIIDDVVYFDLNSASYDWVEKRHDQYPKELTDQYSLVNHTLVYHDPVHAVITLDLDGLMKIEGMESSLLLDITPEKAQVSPFDKAGRQIFPRVQSTTLKFVYPQ